jgi:N-acetyl-anhydromuramyl-L-alanine amidase AmpD
MPQYVDASVEMQKTHWSRRTSARAGVLLHSTEGVNSRRWLTGNDPSQENVASADYLLPRNGDILQLVPIMGYTYHVGVGVWRHVRNSDNQLNMWLIGIELESRSGDHPRYTDPQLISCAALVRRLMVYHRLSFFDIASHGHIAQPPGRRSDPVAFPYWTFARELMQSSPLDPAMVFPAVLP